MDQIKGKTFLITGGAGFIGSHTADALIEQGGRVVIVDDLSTGRKENVNPKAVFYKMNVRSPRLKEILKKERPAVVYHFAFNVEVPRSVKDPIMDAESILDSINVIACASDYKVHRLIFASSGFLYGNTPKRKLLETAPIEPISPYAVSKFAVENYIRYFHKNFGLSYVIFRYATVYGPRQRMGAMADYIRSLDAGGQAKMYGDGEKTRDYVFIDDVVRANLLALKLAENFNDPIFNLGSGKETSLNQVYRFIAKALGRKAKPIYCPERPAELVRYSLGFKKINRVLGWKPTISIAEGLARLIKYYKKGQ